MKETSGIRNELLRLLHIDGEEAGSPYLLLWCPRGLGGWGSEDTVVSIYDTCEWMNGDSRWMCFESSVWLANVWLCGRITEENRSRLSAGRSDWNVRQPVEFLRLKIFTRSKANSRFDLIMLMWAKSPLDQTTLNYLGEDFCHYQKKKIINFCRPRYWRDCTLRGLCWKQSFKNVVLVH